MVRGSCVCLRSHQGATHIRNSALHPLVNLMPVIQWFTFPHFKKFCTTRQLRFFFPPQRMIKSNDFPELPGYCPWLWRRINTLFQKEEISSNQQYHPSPRGGLYLADHDSFITDLKLHFSLLQLPLASNWNAATFGWKLENHRRKVYITDPLEKVFFCLSLFSKAENHYKLKKQNLTESSCALQILYTQQAQQRLVELHGLQVK